MDFATFLQILDSTIRLAMPLLMACLAGLFSERAGIFDIGLEGKMLAAAFLSAAVAFLSGSVWVGLLAGIGVSIVLSIVHGLASITFRGNQLISGVAINFLAAGLTVVVAQNMFEQGGRTPSLEGAARFSPIDLPFAEALSGVPIFGPIYAEIISGHTILVYLGFLCVPLTWWILFRTRFGLRLRAVGENPGAVDTAGISVIGLRYAAVCICGVLCGLAGAYLATSLQAGFVKDMSAGRGFIALAALIFAKWRPWYALYACLLFGFLQALSLRPDIINYLTTSTVALIASVALLIWSFRKDTLKVIAVLSFGLFGWLILRVVSLLAKATGTDLRMNFPIQLIDALPYILTVVILAGFVGKAIPPRAGGEPYVKER